MQGSSAETYAQNPSKKERGERCSRSGRRLISPLEHWRGERQVWDQAMMVRIEEGGINYLTESMASESKGTSSKQVPVKWKKTTEVKEQTGCSNLVECGVNVPSLICTDSHSTEDTIAYASPPSEKCVEQKTEDEKMSKKVVPGDVISLNIVEEDVDSPASLPNAPSLICTDSHSTEDTIAYASPPSEKCIEQKTEDEKMSKKVVPGDVISLNIVEEDVDSPASLPEPVHSGEMNRGIFSGGDKFLSSGNQDLPELQNQKYREKNRQEINAQMREILERLNVIAERQREMQDTLNKVHLCLQQNKRVAVSLLSMPAVRLQLEIRELDLRPIET